MQASKPSIEQISAVIGIHKPGAPGAAVWTVDWIAPHCGQAGAET